MRTVPTQVGAATGNHRGTEGMPEVQKPVLEHAPTETREEEITRETDVVNSVTSVTNPLSVRKMDSPRVEVSYTMVASLNPPRCFSMTEPVYKFIE